MDKINKCPFGANNDCVKCALFVLNPLPTSVKPNGMCAIKKIAIELDFLNKTN